MKDRDEALQRFEITGEMDRAEAESLQLEVRRLAKRYGLDIQDLRIEEVVTDRIE